MPDQRQERSPATVGESLNIKALQDRALELWAVDQASALELGRALLAVREAMCEQHGAFAQWFRENGLEENRVYYCLRRAEGKVSPPRPKPGPPIALTNLNTCIAKYAPKTTGKFTWAGVCVDANGTTVTDGFTILQVSLPPDTPAPSQAGLVPAPFLARLAGEKNCELTFCGENVSASTLEQTTTVKAMDAGYPSVDLLIAKYAPVDSPTPQQGVSFAVKVANLLKLASALSDFNGNDDNTALISVYPDALRADTQNRQQNMVGLMGLMPATHHSVPVQATTCSDEPERSKCH